MQQDKDINIVLDILKVLFALKRNLAGDLKVHLKGHDVGRSEVISLLYIYRDKEKSMGKLCSDIDLKSGSLTAVIDNLVKKGYAGREHDSGDRRKIMINLTDKGKDLASKICDYIRDNFFEKINKLNGKERKEFFDAIDTLKKTVSRFEEF